MYYLVLSIYNKKLEILGCDTPASWKKPTVNLPLPETSLSPAPRDWPGESASMMAAEHVGVWRMKRCSAAPSRIKTRIVIRDWQSSLLLGEERCPPG